MEHLEPVTAAQQRRVDRRRRPVDDLFDEHLVFQEVVGIWRYLSAADEARHLVSHRFEPPAVAFDGEAVGGHGDRQCLGGRVGHECAGHAGVVFEVSVVEPGVLRHRRCGAQIAQPPRPALGLEGHHLVDQSQPPARGRRCAGVRSGPLETLAEAGEGVSVGERVEFGAVK